MKVTMDTKDLRDAMAKAKPVRINRELPILSYAMLDCVDGEATIHATDLYRYVRSNLDGQVEGKFSVLLPINTTMKFLSGDNGKVHIEYDEKKKETSIKRDAGTLKLDVALSVEDFPKKPQWDDMEWSELPDVKWFCRMLGIAIETCAKEESRPVLTGVLLKDGAMASADGFRMTSIKSDKLAFGLEDSEVIVPATTARFVRRLFNGETKVEVGFQRHSHAKDIEGIGFRAGKVVVYAQVIRGNYPKYEGLIPDTYTTKVSFSSPVMMQRLEMVDEGLVTGGIIRNNFCRSEKEEGYECRLSAGSGEDGTLYVMTAPAVLKDGHEGRIAFNLEYLKDAIKHFSIVDLEITTESSPGKFTGDIEELTAVVMPMFVQW
jgi:DNA polymerase III sliding clamp (beta) subunit (PCNA family)